tara:strand:+ start:14515 stop:14718 length:204 start_codon:yes stop_codon:yes gene_type:complete
MSEKIKKSKGSWHGGKGSIQKPSDQEKYAENYDKIFGRKKKKLTEREKVLMDPLAASQRSDEKKKKK